MAAMADILKLTCRQLITSNDLIPGGRTEHPYYIGTYPNKDIERLSKKLERLRKSLTAISVPEHLKDYIISLTIAKKARIGECGEASALAAYNCLKLKVEQTFRVAITGGKVLIPGKINRSYLHSFIVIPREEMLFSKTSKSSLNDFIKDKDIVIDAFLGVSFTYSKSNCSKEQSHWIQYLNRYLLGQDKEESKIKTLSSKITIILIEKMGKSQKELLDDQLTAFEIEANPHFSGEPSIFGDSPGPWRDKYNFPEGVPELL